MPENIIVSCDTLHSFDLYRAFTQYLEPVNGPACQEIYDAIPNGAELDRDSEYWDSEECNHMLQDLFTAMHDSSPYDTYFGSSEGDGACFGYWAEWED